MRFEDLHSGAVEELFLANKNTVKPYLLSAGMRSVDIVKALHFDEKTALEFTLVSSGGDHPKSSRHRRNQDCLYTSTGTTAMTKTKNGTLSNSLPEGRSGD